jgi:multidrug efflux pump subunit AcrA (membrane-fusion protein)
LPCRRPELVVCPLGENGPYVVKDPRTGAYYHLGDEEHFLLTQLDGQRNAETIRAAYAERFGQPLTDEELEEFVHLAQAQGFLPTEEAAGPQPVPRQAPPPDQGSPLGLRLLYWRKSFFDPDRLFTWLAPRLWFCWTAPFLVISAGCIALATGLLWGNRQGLASSLLGSLRWETAVLAGLVLMVVTTCHEFAHGLTCKHHGGEVHEVGFLLVFFMPCFYCNVSDAWLFREKSSRLWVTFAGGYFELFLWALAVFVWRLTTPDSLVNYLAFVVLSACGVQTLFNFNPLLKLDGYYLLADWLEVPNLQQRAGDYLKARLRWLLWGAVRPEPEPCGRALLTYGLVSWLYSLTFLALSLVVLSRFLGARLGVLGLAAVGLLALLSLRALLHGVTAGEVRSMILSRHKRTAVWALLLGGVPAALFLVPMEDRASGPFQVRPVVRAELRAPVAGFVKEVACEEGDRVSPGTRVALLDVPDLASRIARKRSEVREAQARLRLLQTGPRYEEIGEQRRRVERAEAWRDLAHKDLARVRLALAEELKRLGGQIDQYRVELDTARASLDRANRLRKRGGLSLEEHEEIARKAKVFQAQLEQAHAQQRARQALGAQEAEAELVRRDKELADARATLALLEAGTRPEEIEAERARLARLQEETRYLEGMRARLPIHAPLAGVLTTPRLREKVGQFLREGELIAVVEDLSVLEAEVSVAEQDVAGVQVGQSVRLKARALPFETFTARVERIAPAAGPGEAQGTVRLSCGLGNESTGLRPGMTGHARVYTGQCSLGKLLLLRGLRFLRTEFWW